MLSWDLYKVHEKEKSRILWSILKEQDIMALIFDVFADSRGTLLGVLVVFGALIGLMSWFAGRHNGKTKQKALPIKTQPKKPVKRES